MVWKASQTDAKHFRRNLNSADFCNETILEIGMMILSLIAIEIKEKLF